MGQSSQRTGQKSEVYVITAALREYSVLGGNQLGLDFGQPWKSNEGYWGSFSRNSIKVFEMKNNIINAAHKED